MKRNAQALIICSRSENRGNWICKLIFRRQNPGQNRNIQIANDLYKCANFIYSGTTGTTCMEPTPPWKVASRSAIQEVLKTSWNPKVYYYVHKSSSLLLILNHMNPVHQTIIWFMRESRVNWIREILATNHFKIFFFFVFPLAVKSINVGLYKIVSIHVVLFRCETWSVALMQEHRLRVLENKVLRRIFLPNRGEIIWGWKHFCKIMSFIKFTLRQILLEGSSQEGLDGQGI